jgi:hypothetical protein
MYAHVWVRRTSEAGTEIAPAGSLKALPRGERQREGQLLHAGPHRGPAHEIGDRWYMHRTDTFPPEVVAKLKTYVYRLIDPRNGETFYVGKGQGDRVFSHVRGEIDGDEIGE